jgi:FkbM family methyltransferase
MNDVEPPSGAADPFRLVVGGTEILFATTDAYSQWWFYPDYTGGKLHEPQVTRLFAGLLQRCRLFVDVGVNIGYFSCIAARLMPQGEVHGFEMNAEFLPLAQRNVEINGCGNVHLHHLAVAEAAGVVWHEPGTVIHGLYPGTPPAAAAPAPHLMSVAAVSLDDFFAAGFATPAVIKIDVEGAELKVLQGMRGILGRGGDLRLLVEIHPGPLAALGASAGELLGFLFAHGFAVAEVLGLRQDLGAQESPLRELEPTAILEENAMLYCRPKGAA